METFVVYEGNGAKLYMEGKKAYLDYKGLANIDWEHFGSTSNIALLITSLVLTIGMIVIVAKNQYKHGRK